jgi:hypothetical protein
MKRPKQKVFCIGFMKTGTTTMNRVLTTLGYRVSHDSWKWLPVIMRRDWPALKSLAAPWDALEDNPIPLIYKELDTLFPGSKFILTHRDSERWYQSVSYHIGHLRSPMHEWLFGLNKGLPIQDKAHTLAVYEQHIQSVRAYFKDRPGDLLIVNVSRTSAWDEICAFLNEEVPEAPFPHANRSAFEKDKHAGFGKRLNYWKKKLVYPIRIARLKAQGLIPDPSDRLRSL